MTTPVHAGRMLFVNLPVADVERSKAFFATLGFSYNPMLTDQTAACMLVGEHAFVMLLSREKFAEFAKLPIADPATHTLALYCFSVCVVGSAIGSFANSANFSRLSSMTKACSPTIMQAAVSSVNIGL